MAFYLLVTAFLIATVLACRWHEQGYHLTALACLLGAMAVLLWMDDHGYLPDAAGLEARRAASEGGAR
ncbi:hypothetical protein [Methylobacterium nigriterrae]|uniref:hypothetical protein n=1 Tax=Methylobacterium nigriterrae TaxID=3127512 RepID=UPI0030135176